jgi:hypothetical protein
MALIRTFSKLLYIFVYMVATNTGQTYSENGVSNNLYKLLFSDAEWVKLQRFKKTYDWKIAVAWS